jgi:hypothetical protein
MCNVGDVDNGKDNGVQREISTHDDSRATVGDDGVQEKSVYEIISRIIELYVVVPLICAVMLIIAFVVKCYTEY